MKDKMTYDAVFVSDVHLGTTRCNTKKFYKFLKKIKTKKLVLVGDIIDIYCMEKYNTQWKKEHTEGVHQILNLAKKGVEIVYIPGNHEGMLRRYCPFEHNNFKMCEEYVYKTKNGDKYLCTHGDQHSEFSSGSWKQLVFNKGYELITPMSLFLEKIFGFSLVYALKHTVRGKKYISQYENDLANYCRQRGEYKGIIVGHIHHANTRKIDGIEYMCCGDFVDTCSAIVEKEGEFKLLTY